MNKRLILIISDGAGNEPLQGVRLDKENYLNFFMSPEGGYWQENEICIFDKNDFCLNWLKAYSLQYRTLNNPIDYFVIVYCGHGYTDQYHNIWLQVRPDCDLKLDDLLGAVADTRCLLIADSCRAVARMDEGGRLTARRQLFSAIRDESRCYGEICRNFYEHLISRTPKKMQLVLFADSFNETAGESERLGGYYSYFLLQAAKQMKESFQRQQIAGRSTDHCASPIYCHRLAVPEVVKISNDQQHPEILRCSRSVNKLPFVVVPNWQRQLDDI